MDRKAIYAISIWLSLFFTLSLVSSTSYSFYSNNENYTGIVEDPEWVDTLPEGLSREVSEEIAVLLSLSPETTQDVYLAILGSTDEEWAVEEGIDVVNDLLDFLNGRKDSLESSIDITEQKSPVISAIISSIPSFIVDTISGLLPNEIPLENLVNMKDLDNTRGIFGFMDNFRLILLSIFILSVFSLPILRLEKNEYFSILYHASLGSFFMGALGISLMTLRIKMAFDGMDLSFMKSFGSIINVKYLLYGSIFLILPLSALIVTYFYINRNNVKL